MERLEVGCHTEHSVPTRGIFARTDIALAIGMVSFLVGVIAGFHLDSVFAKSITLEGPLLVNPPGYTGDEPIGTYVDLGGPSASFRVVYVRHPQARSYVGRKIRARGFLSVTCASGVGAKCFPILMASEIESESTTGVVSGTPFER